jgi:hypothetical protein
MRRVALAAAAALVALLMLVHGCGSANSGAGASRVDAGADAESAADARPAKGRAQLWAENCQRCHNARPASWYSEREWEVAMHHMFVRGYLTRHEHDSVMEFFRASR